jgi:hypothetical protein
MAVAIDADAYAATRVGIFFPANNQTGADGNLTGQCVTLAKWFMAEMANVPNPFAARGDARNVGINLVAQGLADEVPAGQQREGDLVVYEYGEYGHIGVLLSGNRLFQENANVAGATKKVLSDGTVVYSSTIVPVYPSLGGVAAKYYRLKSYAGGSMAKFTKEQEQTLALMATGSVPGKDYNYPFTVQDISSDALDQLLQTWSGRVTTITKEMENAVADGISGIPNYIGWAGYNSQFVGKPVVAYLFPMVQYWIKAKPAAKPTDPGGVYKPVTTTLYEKVS